MSQIEHGGIEFQRNSSRSQEKSTYETKKVNNVSKSEKSKIGKRLQNKSEDLSPNINIRERGCG